MKRRQQTGHGQLLSGLQDGFEEEGVVSARMRLLYDYRAPAGTRWSPTTEQLRELQALFHVGGLRTPTTAQISRITARLRAHGRIEGRNVFYWFQNQKARERKRRLELMAQEEPSSLYASELTERAGAPQPMQQPKRPVSCRQAGQFANCVSSQCDPTTKETDSLSALHLWPCLHQAKLPLAVEQAVAQEEAAGGILLQESACAQSEASYALRPRLNFDFGHPAPFLQAEDEQSEVSDAIMNAQPSSFQAISTEYNCGALMSAAILPAADGPVTQRAVTMGRVCPDDASGVNELDEIDSVSTLETSHAHRILRSSYDNSRDLNSRFPLVLFPLSPLQQEKQAAPPASSCCCSHNQAQHRLSLLGEESLRLSLTSSTQLLDLNLAIDH